MTFQEILLAEPRLIDLMYDVKDYMEINKEADWNKRTYDWGHGFKPRMVRLVGFEAENIKLADCEPYDITYRFFIDLMDI